MVNEAAYNYLKKYSGRYKIENLKKKLLNSGYSKKEIEEAVNYLKKEKVSGKSFGKPVAGKTQKKTFSGSTMPQKNKSPFSIKAKMPKQGIQQPAYKKGSPTQAMNMQSKPKIKPLKQPNAKNKNTQKDNTGNKKPKPKIMIWVLLIFLLLLMISGLLYFFIL